MRKLVVLLLLGLPATGAGSLDQAGFDACLEDLRAHARAQGLSEHAVRAGLDGLELQHRVLELDRSQPEFVQTFWQYLERRVTEQRVDRGRELLRRHRTLLDRIHADYGVQPHYLVALWGLETNYGSHFGAMPVLDSLATLACDRRRSAYFAGELVEALRILEAGHMDRDGMRGSWAGAMGHTQFMPSTFTRYAVDASGTGRIDLWNDLADVFASSANYLSRIGWRDGERWGREVRLPSEFDWTLAGSEQRSVREWAEAGVRAADGSPLPDSDMQAALLLPAGHQGPVFLVYHNFQRIMRWNTSTSYALSVGILADRIAGTGGLHAQRPADDAPLHRDEVKELQRRLNEQGFQAGEVDGIPGRMTRAALQAFQLSRGLPADGHPDRAMLERLRQ
ncbi:MAG: lytic murein transglycosylase [Ectothiorhodospiraceae bacterium]|nr:lytic murein transglycosylase [Ectothiorhodospiraceae bacterium]